MAEFEKVIGTITVNKNILQVDNQFAGNMFSSDLTYTVNFSDDFWTGFDILEWYAASSVVGETVVCEYDSANKKLKIPYGAYIKNGPLYISMRGIKDSVKYASNILVLLVGENINIEENDIVNDPSWLDKVQSIIDEIFITKYDPQYEALVQKVEKQISANKELLDKTQEQQNQIDNAIDIMGDYEIVQEDPTQIRFKKGDGTYGDTVNLGDNLASKSMVNAGYDTYNGNSYSGSASDYGIEIGKASGAYEQEGTPTPESPIEPKFFEPKHINTNGGNLFDASKLPTKTQGGVTVTNNGDGSFTISGSGNLSRDFSMYFEDATQLLKKGVLTILTENKTHPYVSVVVKSSTGQLQITNSFSKSESKDISNILDGENISLNIAFLGESGREIVPGTIKPILYQDGDGTWYPFNANSTPLDITLRALPNGVKDTYENRVITRRVGEITFDGSNDEYWMLSATKDSTKKRFRTDKLTSLIKKAESVITVVNLLSDRYKVNSANNTYDLKEGISVDTNGKVMIYNEEYSTKTIDEWKQYLQSNPIKVWYQLAEPTTEQVDLPVIPSYYPFTNAWHDSEVEASDLTWNILAGQYGSGQTTIKKDEAVLTELDLNTERTSNPTTVKVQLQDSEGKVLYLETSSENVYIQSGRFSGKTVQQVLENSIQAISATDEYIEVDVPDSMTQSIDEEFLVDEVDESETETE